MDFTPDSNVSSDSALWPMFLLQGRLYFAKWQKSFLHRSILDQSQWPFTGIGLILVAPNRKEA